MSVVIPAYNAGSFLVMALDSVARQTWQRLEVIVVDDGSTDDTAEVAERHPVRPKVVRRTNAGDAVARNHGAALAAGDWLAFLDSDDLWHRDHISRALVVASRTGAEAVATGHVSFALIGASVGWRGAFVDEVLTEEQLEDRLSRPLPDVETVRTRSVGAEDVRSRGMTGTSMMVVRRSLLQMAGGFPSVFGFPADLVCWFQLARFGRVLVAEDATVHYRVHSGAMTSDSAELVRALAAYTAMWYGNSATPYDADAAAFRSFGNSKAVDKLCLLLDDAKTKEDSWRLRVAGSFARLLVTDARCRRDLQLLLLKRRAEITAPRAAAIARRALRALRQTN